MPDGVRVEGAKELAKALEQLLGKTQKKFIRTALREAAKPIREEARRRVPVDEGKLKKSIKTRAAKRQSKNTAAVTISTSPVGHLQEFGTVNHGAQPFLRPAYDENRGKAIAAFRARLADLIEKEADKL